MCVRTHARTHARTALLAHRRTACARTLNHMDAGLSTQAHSRTKAHTRTHMHVHASTEVAGFHVASVVDGGGDKQKIVVVSAAVASAPGRGSPPSHLHHDWARPCPICAGTGLPPLPHPRRDRACCDQSPSSRRWVSPAHRCVSTPTRWRASAACRSRRPGPPLLRSLTAACACARARGCVGIFAGGVCACACVRGCGCLVVCRIVAWVRQPFFFPFPAASARRAAAPIRVVRRPYSLGCAHVSAESGCLLRAARKRAAALLCVRRRSKGKS